MLIQLEKIKVELEKLADNCPASYDVDYGNALHDVQNILDTLESVTDRNDLEKEIQKWMVNECGPSDFNPYADHWCAEDIIKTAKHFYELGLNARKGE